MADKVEAQKRMKRFWQAAQLCHRQTPNEAATAAMNAVKGNELTPNIFSGNVGVEDVVERIVNTPTVELTSTDLEKAVAMFGDYFVLNRAFRLSNDSFASEKDPCLDLTKLKAFYSKIQEYDSAQDGNQGQKDGDGDMKMGSMVEYMTRLLKKLGDLSAEVVSYSSAEYTWRKSLIDQNLKEKMKKQSKDAQDLFKSLLQLGNNSIGSSSSTPCPGGMDVSCTPPGGMDAARRNNTETDVFMSGNTAGGGSSSSTASPPPGPMDQKYNDPWNPLDTPDGLRFLLIILYHPLLPDPESYPDWNRIMRAFRVITPKRRDLVAEWLSLLPIAEFQEFVQNLQQFITITFCDAFSSDLPPDASENGVEQVPQHVWDFFVTKTSQLCKNGLASLDIFWRSNEIRRQKLRKYKINEMLKGTVAMITEENNGSANPNSFGAGGTGSAGGSASCGPPGVLSVEEFKNDALNDVDRVIRHDYYSTLYHDWHREEESDHPTSQQTNNKKRVPTTLDEILFKSEENQWSFGLIEYNFCLDASAKCRFLMVSTADQQRSATRNEILNQMMGGARRVNPYLVLKVRRDRLIEDTLVKMASIPPSGFRKTLKIVFEGEQGVDEGGVQKEYFQLLIEELYNPAYGMFVYNKDNKSYWFNPGSFESNLQYELFGTLLGMAIYNHVILDIRFPLVVYQKLLCADPDGKLEFEVEDLMQINPEMARSLMQLLEFDGDVESVFCRDFVASYNSFGADVVIPLKEGGENIPVTNTNRREYVEAYIDWYFNISIMEKFRSFKKGFLRCMADDNSSSSNGGHPMIHQNLFLTLFRPSELELLICGSESIDFSEQKGNCEYDGYTKDSSIIVWFWEIVLTEMTEEEKKQLLAFMTGSSRAPPKGLSAPEAKLTIGRQGPDSHALPTAHTCFNHLLIPEYTDREKLKAKLLLAVANNQGFGLI